MRFFDTAVEEARTARGDVQRAMRAVLAGLGSDARSTPDDGFLAGEWPGILAESGPGKALGEAGHLVVIDQREGRSWEDRVFHCRRRSKDGAPVEVRGI